jgi:hypothetical protein
MVSTWVNPEMHWPQLSVSVAVTVPGKEGSNETKKDELAPRASEVVMAPPPAATRRKLVLMETGDQLKVQFMVLPPSLRTVKLVCASQRARGATGTLAHVVVLTAPASTKTDSGLNVPLSTVITGASTMLSVRSCMRPSRTELRRQAGAQAAAAAPAHTCGVCEIEPELRRTRA